MSAVLDGMKRSVVKLFRSVCVSVCEYVSDLCPIRYFLYILFIFLLTYAKKYITCEGFKNVNKGDVINTPWICMSINTSNTFKLLSSSNSPYHSSLPQPASFFVIPKIQVIFGLPLFLLQVESTPIFSLEVCLLLFIPSGHTLVAV